MTGVPQLRVWKDKLEIGRKYFWGIHPTRDWYTEDMRDPCDWITRQQQIKMGKRFEQTPHLRRCMGEHTQRCSTSFVLGKSKFNLQWDTTMQLPCWLKLRQTTPGLIEKLEPSHSHRGNATWCSCCGRQRAVYPPSHYPDILFLGICPEEIRADTRTNPCTRALHSSFMQTGNNPRAHQHLNNFFQL